VKVYLPGGGECSEVVRGTRYVHPHGQAHRLALHHHTRVNKVAKPFAVEGIDPPPPPPSSVRHRSTSHTQRRKTKRERKGNIPVVLAEKWREGGGENAQSIGNILAEMQGNNALYGIGDIQAEMEGKNPLA